MAIHMQIPEEDFPAFMTYVAIGTLYAIRNGTVPSEIGNWTLGPPNISEFLLKQQNMPRRVIRVFEMGDELHALEVLAPDKFDDELGEMIRQLEAALAKLDHPTWRIKWPRRARSSKASKGASKQKARKSSARKRKIQRQLG